MAGADCCCCCCFAESLLLTGSARGVPRKAGEAKEAARAAIIGRGGENNGRGPTQMAARTNLIKVNPIEHRYLAHSTFFRSGKGARERQRERERERDSPWDSGYKRVQLNPRTETQPRSVNLCCSPRCVSRAQPGALTLDGRRAGSTRISGSFVAAAARKRRALRWAHKRRFVSPHSWVAMIAR